MPVATDVLPVSSLLPKTSELDPDACWDAVCRRDKAVDGSFVYAVRTTGIFCRPSCPSRLARRENVSFHASPDAAKALGFRACMRCHPDAQAPSARQASLIADLCREIESSETPPTLAALAARANLSPWHLQRLFKRLTGVTPRAYAAAHRANRTRAALDGDGSVTAAIHDGGYASGGHFYAEADDVLGMTPTRWRAGGVDTDIRFAIGRCSLGDILVAASGRGLCAILLGDDPEALAHSLQDRFPAARLHGDDAEFARWMATVIGFVDDPARGLDLPLDVRGTAFQQRVWQALRAIPPGTTASYTDIAARIGAPAAVRAVAGACAANVLAVAIPCHRVVRQDGNLSGYRWGVARKRALLAAEREDTP